MYFCAKEKYRNNMQKTDIRDLQFNELLNYISSIEEKPFRAKQICEWLWKRPVQSFEQMSNLSKATRDKLSGSFDFKVLKPEETRKSTDGTQKTLFRTQDGNPVEGVLIPSKNRTTACISSQSGCALGCAFCATASLKFRQHLSAGEIFDQVVFLNQQSVAQYGCNLDNIVLMGMGEPLLNYTAVKQAIDHITSPEGLGFSPRRVTLSTAGIVDGIRRLADDGVKFNLAVSLHTANNGKRNMLMPINKTNPLNELSRAIVYFYEKTHTRVTLEYLLLGGINDSEADARELALYCRSFPCKINLIEYNPVPGLDFRKSAPANLNGFKQFIESRNMVVNQRQSRGIDIAAACGQLAAEKKEA
jgi:23S rRNA (adenine2503-C2)-methyltransferase